MTLVWITAGGPSWEYVIELSRRASLFFLHLVAKLELLWTELWLGGLHSKIPVRWNRGCVSLGRSFALFRIVIMLCAHTLLLVHKVPLYFEEMLVLSYLIIGD